MFELIPFGKIWTHLSPKLCVKVSLLFFYKDDFGIKYLLKVDMPLNKETKPLTNVNQRNPKYLKIPIGQKFAQRKSWLWIVSFLFLR